MTIELTPEATEVRFVGDRMVLVLADSRELSIPLKLFPRLATATPQQRSKWELVGGGIGIHWPEVDEDISVENLLLPKASLRSA